MFKVLNPYICEALHVPYKITWFNFLLSVALVNRAAKMRLYLQYPLPLPYTSICLQLI
jgi:hypothetical protein